MPIRPVVDANWLQDWRGEPGVVVADVRWYLDGHSGRAAYELGHIPGAVFVDPNTHLAAPPSPATGRHPLPTPEDFAAALGALGIGDDDIVIAYDDAGGSIAARLVWMLRTIGHDAALLDGGLAAWAGPLETASAERPPVRFAAVDWPADRLAGIDEVARTPLVFDARAPERYLGDMEPIDPRAGHIPGARNVPFGANLDPATGRFLPAEQLRARFVAEGAGEGTDVVAYCGSGITACHNLLALELAGLGPGRLYPGSWSQWSSDPARPAKKGHETGGAPIS